MAKELKEKEKQFPMLKRNYQVMLIGLVFIFTGFILMIGGGSKDVNEFNEAIFNTRRLTIAPILIITGYIIEIVAIMIKPTSDANSTEKGV